MNPEVGEELSAETGVMFEEQESSEEFCGWTPERLKEPAAG